MFTDGFLLNLNKVYFGFLKVKSVKVLTKVIGKYSTHLIEQVSLRRIEDIIYTSKFDQMLESKLSNIRLFVRNILAWSIHMKPANRVCHLTLKRSY